LIPDRATTSKSFFDVVILGITHKRAPAGFAGLAPTLSRKLERLKMREFASARTVFRSPSVGP
jgi:hypothetical protein